MTELSPQAQAVLASIDVLYNYGCPEDHDIAAAALQAAADQVVPEDGDPIYGLTLTGADRQVVRCQFLAIAAELKRMS